MAVDLGRVGIWSRELRYNPDRGAPAAAAAELEDLGYGAIFIPDAGGDVLGAVGHLLAATRRMPFATGVLNIWMHDPAEVASRHASLVARFGPRFLLGLGSSHAPLVEGALRVPYARPYSKMVAYLDALDAAAGAGARGRADAGRARPPDAVPRARRGRPRRIRTWSRPSTRPRPARRWAPASCSLPSRPWCSTPIARRGRERARAFVNDYLALPNYVRNLRRLGFTDDDLRGPASDRLVDALVAHGDEDAIAARVRAHHDAGADHVCVYVVGGDPRGGPAARRLAPPGRTDALGLPPPHRSYMGGWRASSARGG